MPGPTDMMPASVDVVTVTLQGEFWPVRAPGLKVFAKRQHSISSKEGLWTEKGPGPCGPCLTT